MGRARSVMKLLVCLLTCCGLVVGSPPWMSATPGLRDPVTQCPDYPFPTVSENTLLEQLQPFLDKLAANISKLLQLTESPGGVALGLVYNQSLIWMKGFGQTSKQGESYTLINPSHFLFDISFSRHITSWRADCIQDRLYFQSFHVTDYADCS